MRISALVFDFGGVLIDWNPRYVFRKIFKEAHEMEWFLENVCSNSWNLALDKGYPFAAGVKDLQEQYPDFHDHIASYHLHWADMLGGEMPESVRILQEIQAANYKVYGLTNWSHETFPEALRRYSFLGTLDGIVVSGQEKLVKPDPALFRLLIDRYQLHPPTTVFIDDNMLNVTAAEGLGFISLHFTTADKLRQDLQALSVL